MGFAIKTNLIDKLPDLPKAVSDRLMTLRLQLDRNQRATLISVYAPTMMYSDEFKSRFYEELDSLIKSVPRQDKLILLGDFNARVGTDFQTWKGVLGRNGVGKCNSNGQLLLETCMEHDLVITNTLFRLSHHNRTSRMHPRSKHWHLLDYIITRRKDSQDFRITKAMRGADCWTDHRLIMSKLHLHACKKRRPQGQRTAKRLNVKRLQCEEICQSLESELESNLSDFHPDWLPVEEGWSTFKDVVYNSFLKHLGRTVRRQQDWFHENDVEIQALLDEKHRLHQAYLKDTSSSNKKDAYTAARRVLQCKLRAMQNSWFSRKADEIEAYADSKNLKRFYTAVKEVYGPQSTGTSPLLSSDGSTLITDKPQILQRRAEHFHNVLNRPSSISDTVLAQLPQIEVNTLLADPPSLLEVNKVYMYI